MKRVKFGIIVTLNMVILCIQLKSKKFNEVITKYCNTCNYKPLKQYTKEEKVKIGKDIMLLIQMIEDVSRILPFNTKCLHRTLVGFKLFRGHYRMPVKFVIGVKKFPFESHAWLKWSDPMIGQNLYELNEQTKEYEVIIDSSSYKGR